MFFFMDFLEFNWDNNSDNMWDFKNMIFGFFYLIDVVL